MAFILGVLALLGAVCAVFPKDGIDAGSLHLGFPTLAQMFRDDDEGAQEAEEENPDGPDPCLQGLYEMRTALLADSCGIMMPTDSLDALDRFFDALDSAGVNPVRIVYYGDSQIEEDRMSCTLRDSLQCRFGGGGVGLLPAERHYTYRAGVSATEGFTRYSLYGEGERRANRKYGPLFSFNRIEGSGGVSISSSSRSRDNARLFSNVTVYAGNVSSMLKVSLNGQTDTLPAGTAAGSLTFALGDSVSKARLNLTGRADIYGISVDGVNGVCVDNVALRGCSGTIFTSLDREAPEYYFSHNGARLVILQFGGNTIPGVGSAKGCGKYAQSIREQIGYIREVAPRADILFIGPSDMATVRRGVRQTYPVLPEFIDSLKTAVLDCGAAYWDMYRVMGGNGSMVRWVKASPALAGPDYIHFTPAGAERMGARLYGALMEMYGYYRLRKRK